MNRIFRHTNWFRQHKPWIIFAIAVIFIIAVCLLFVCFMKEQPWGMDKRGQFGDMFGVLGAVFSGLAFAGLIVTLIQQHDDLKTSNSNEKTSAFNAKKSLKPTSNLLFNAKKWRSKIKPLCCNDLRQHSLICLDL